MKDATTQSNFIENATDTSNKINKDTSSVSLSKDAVEMIKIPSIHPSMHSLLTHMKGSPHYLQCYIIKNFKSQ